jgi:hypothetical protein
LLTPARPKSRTITLCAASLSTFNSILSPVFTASMAAAEIYAIAAKKSQHLRRVVFWLKADG